MIPYSKPKLSDFYTLFQTKLLENHTLHSGTYPCSLGTDYYLDENIEKKCLQGLKR